MSPRAALLVAVRNVWEVATDDLPGGTDDTLLALVPEEARRVLLLDRLAVESYAYDAGQLRGLADAARIAREEAKRWSVGYRDFALRLAKAIEARAREVAGEKGDE